MSCETFSLQFYSSLLSPGILTTLPFYPFTPRLCVLHILQFYRFTAGFCNGNSVTRRHTSGIRSGRFPSCSYRATQFPTFKQMLPGARVAQVELQGERLRFRRLEGHGPETGWVSLKLKDRHRCRAIARCSVDGSGSASRFSLGLGDFDTSFGYTGCRRNKLFIGEDSSSLSRINVTRCGAGCGVFAV